jgi:hypothetical protein
MPQEPHLPPPPNNSSNNNNNSIDRWLCTIINTNLSCPNTNQFAGEHTYLSTLTNGLDTSDNVIKGIQSEDRAPAGQRHYW